MIFRSIAGLALFVTGSAHGALFSVSLPGTTDYDVWAGMTCANHPAYATASAGVGTLPTGTSAWPTPFGSNLSGSGDSVLNKPTGGSGSFTASGLYHGMTPRQLHRHRFHPSGGSGDHRLQV